MLDFVNNATQYQHSIALLVDYDQRFSSMSDEMEDELMKMREAGTLTDEFAKTRQQDNIQSALIC